MKVSNQTDFYFEYTVNLHLKQLQYISYSSLCTHWMWK